MDHDEILPIVQSVFDRHQRASLDLFDVVTIITRNHCVVNISDVSFCLGIMWGREEISLDRETKRFAMVQASEVTNDV